ncbi:MAG: hypothetical protein ACHREM_10445 [Polyangiales bacterium]
MSRDVAYVTPESNGVVALKLSVTTPDKVDLLLMIDNSASMADKQTELTRRVPTLIQLLANPAPDPTTGKVPKSVADIHVGVITSSLGSYGTSACDPKNVEMNDHGHLLPRTVSEASGSGFSYNPAKANEPLSQPCPSPVVASAVSWAFDSSTKDAPQFMGAGAGVVSLEAATSCVVASVHENGCGYEASLESVYHFLMDPAPYLDAKAKCTGVEGGSNCDNIVLHDVDKELLAERQAFLRPDSLLAVILLTDENDGSVNVQQPWDWFFTGLPGGSMPRGWKACENLPDDTETDDHSVLTAQGCEWCQISQADPGGNCTVPWQAPGSTDADHVNLRMFEQTKRYGMNALYPRKRYVNGFTQTQVVGSDGKLGANGIFAGGRTPDFVVFATIVGVPEFLVADPTTHQPKTLGEPEWDKIVSPIHTTRDAHMIESIEPRAGVAAFRPSKSDSNDNTAIPSDFADLINGGDRQIADLHDLQYACLGLRTDPTPDSQSDCSSASDTAQTSPLCGVDPASKLVTQPRYKAYPGLRELRVLHEISLANPAVGTVAASICAQSFAPAVESIVAKLQAVLDSQCIKTQLAQDSTTKEVNCVIEEVFETNTFGSATPDQAGACEAIGHGYCTPGQAPCRLPASMSADAGANAFSVVPVDFAARQLSLRLPEFDSASNTMMVLPKSAYASSAGNVFVDTVDASGATTTHLICEELQLASARTSAITQEVTDACATQASFELPSGIDGGWCYSSVDAVIGDACRARGSQGTVRFLGIDKPHSKSQVFTVCNE